MRIILILALLCTSLTACTVFAQPAVHPTAQPAPQPTVQRPPLEVAEMLYRALAIQAMVQESFLNNAAKIQTNEITADYMLGVVFRANMMLNASAEMLDYHYTGELFRRAKIARGEQNIMQEVAYRLVNKDLANDDIAHALRSVDIAKQIQLYTDDLVKLGFSENDVEMMNVRFKSDIAKTFMP